MTIGQLAESTGRDLLLTYLIQAERCARANDWGITYLSANEKRK